MHEEMIQVDAGTLIGEVAKLKVRGYRFVTLSCTEIDANHLDILYHFDKDLTLIHLRMTAEKVTPVSSISHVYFSALLVENEIQDFFGISFEGLAVDYRGTLYLEEDVMKAPFCRLSERAGEKKESDARKEGAP